MLKELSFADYAERTHGGAATPVFREFLADRETPVAILSRLGRDDDAFLLESVAGGERPSRYSYIGLDPREVVATGTGESPLGKVRAAMAARRFASAPELPPLQGGAIGYLAYDAVRSFVPRVRLAPEEATPQSAFLLVDTLVVFDHVRETATIVRVTATGDGETPREAYDRAMAEIAALHERLMSATSISAVVSRAEGDEPFLGDFVPEMDEAEFEKIVESCKAAIRAGEVIQIVPSQKFTARTNLSALALYRALRVVNPSPYNFFLRVGGKTLIGSSPEELVKLTGTLASTSPIAGTRPRGPTPGADEQLERELLADPKERAEHVMLVDLGRNDLGRVARTGSVKVESYAQVERYSHVMHIVSKVTARLDDGKDAFDLLEATFPAGTLTGAPKVRAMELLAELEKSPRGIYGGAAGYFSYTGDMDFAIVIRTMVLDGGVLTMRAGAGIVADSDPKKEYEETLNKSRAAFAAARFATTIR